METLAQENMLIRMEDAVRHAPTQGPPAKDMMSFDPHSCIFFLSGKNIQACGFQGIQSLGGEVPEESPDKAEPTLKIFCSIK